MLLAVKLTLGWYNNVKILVLEVCPCIDVSLRREVGVQRGRREKGMG